MKGNKKGFTLIELLAVIIVLAIIMVFAVPAVMTTSSNAQQKAFQLYAKRVLEKSSEYVETQKMLGSSIGKFLDLNTIGLNADSGYFVCVQYAATGDTYTLTLSMTNGQYCYSAVTDPTVANLTKSGCKAASELSMPAATATACTAVN